MRAAVAWKSHLLKVADDWCRPALARLVRANRDRPALEDRGAAVPIACGLRDVAFPFLQIAAD